jgi:putative addiction module component (TIGR02574 family)
MKTVDAIATEALLLPKDQRLTLAHRILASVEPEEGESVEEAWDEEIRARIEKYDANPAAGIPGPDVFKELDRKLKR